MLLKWLRPLLAHGRSKERVLAVAGAPERSDRPDENPIHALLNAAGVSWRLPRAALAARYGIRQHPAYGWDVIEIRTPQPIVKGLLWPLSVQVFSQFSPDVPATDFSGITSIGDDARENLLASMNELGARLGEPKFADNSNTLSRRWAFGAAALSLTVWPPEMQRRPLTNPAHKRDPRLKTGCHVLIKTGWRKAVTAGELGWLNSFVPIDRISVYRNITVDSAYGLPAEQSELEFVREPRNEMASFFGFIGCSADRAALIFCHAQLYLVPMTDVIGFHVDRIRPAKGAGGSRLHVDCRPNYRGARTKRLLISAADGVEDSNGLASAISSATGKPLELGDYVYDV